MRARVDSAITLDLSDVLPKVAEQLRRELSLPNPAYVARLRRGLHPGAEPPSLCFLDEQQRSLRLPRGAIHILKRVALQNNLSVVCDDRRVLPESRLHCELGPVLRGYQSSAVDKFARITQGYAVMPCGSGKTMLAMGAIACLRTPTLILVHTLDLAEQWMGELRAKLGIHAGIIGDGIEQVALVTVALVQSLVRWGDEKLDELLCRFGLLVIDEVHHVASTAFQRVVGRCPARYRLGLTATPDREDGLGALLDWFVGERLASISHEELVQSDVLASAEIRVIDTDFTYPYACDDDYAAMLSALAVDEARNQLIIGIVLREARAGHTCLVLSGRVDHCDQLAAALQRSGVQAAALTSQVSRAKRKDVLQRAKDGHLLVLVATSLADEGLDLPRLSRVFLAFPGRARARTVQRLGRVMRRHPSKHDAVLFDFVDRNVPILRRQHLSRQRMYAEVLGPHYQVHAS